MGMKDSLPLRLFVPSHTHPCQNGHVFFFSNKTQFCRCCYASKVSNRNGYRSIFAGKCIVRACNCFSNLLLVVNFNCCFRTYSFAGTTINVNVSAVETQMHSNVMMQCLAKFKATTCKSSMFLCENVIRFQWFLKSNHRESNQQKLQL